MQLVDTIKEYIIAVDDDEVNAIYQSLAANGHDGLAGKLWDLVYGDECPGCDYDDGSTVGKLTIDVDSSQLDGLSEKLEKIARLTLELNGASWYDCETDSVVMSVKVRG